MTQRQKGVILTYVETLDTLEDCVRLGGYDALKVVTGWGMPRGWDDATRKRVIDMVPNLIVRTVSGDPSYARPFDPLSGKSMAGATGRDAKYWQYDFLNPDEVQQEIQPWYNLKPTIMIELGNEPNVYNQDDDFIWRWAHALEQAIERCRQVFPQALLISPGFMMDPRGNMRRFYEIGHKQIAMCDYAGVHFYEFFAFNPGEAPATKGELRDAVDLHQQFFPDMPWYVTEYGIHNTDRTPRQLKGERYARLLHGGEGTPVLPVNVVGAVYYHLQMKGDIHPEYHIYPEGDRAYSETYAVVGAASEAVEVLGGGVGTSAPSGTPMDEIAGRIARLTADLATIERELLERRAMALSAGDESFTAADARELLRVQQMRAALEKSLRLATRS